MDNHHPRGPDRSQSRDLHLRSVIPGTEKEKSYEFTKESNF